MPLSTSMSSNVTASSIVFIGRMLEEVGSSSKELCNDESAQEALEWWNIDFLNIKTSDFSPNRTQQNTKY